MKRLTLAVALIGAACVFAAVAPGAWGAIPNPKSKFLAADCGDQGANAMCAETFDGGQALHEAYYVGHDEPELAFYSNRPGAGYNMTYQLTLPKEPNALPTQSSPGAFWNFQLHPTFWLGLVMCDSQSYPQFTTTCAPDSDTNIKNDANPSSPNFIGKHAGTAYEELQFYPPGWANWNVGTSCAPTQWCAALNIDSLSENGATGAPLNASCQGQVFGGEEYINFAFVTRSGIPQGPPGPKSSLLSPTSLVPDPSLDLMMNGGDKLLVTLHDTFQGLQIVINDQSTGQTGTMTASAANGFSQIQAAPTGTTCNEIPYSFHPMYATASEQTRNVWGAHASGNAVFSDEIGHWDYCDNIPFLFSPCAGNEGGQGVAPSPADGDDLACIGPGQDPFGTMFVQVGGCEFENDGFDGTSYVASDWPGNGNPLTPSPVRFHSPYMNGSKFQTYDRVAFETDLPRIERPNPNNAFLNCVGLVTTNPTGAGCTNPPSTDTGEQAWYPLYSTHQTTGPVGACEWQEGGTQIAGTINTFGGSSATEYGSLVAPTYQNGATGTEQLWEDFRNIVKNPCAN